uniref:Uncharacterized protein n=1 Tax=Guillardia theta TaxID=55529 RepID=A0A7S4N633_GUITH|mmetsp:Transcript_17401/g.57592  ORF Transcript_17401/g.57592 Transcript_17401/m.57592 type:complete len:1172 (+) Transcript_17401:79-3594(+)
MTRAWMSPDQMITKMLKIVILLLLCPPLQSRVQQAVGGSSSTFSRICQLRSRIHPCRGGSDWQSDNEESSSGGGNDWQSDNEESSSGAMSNDLERKVTRLMEMGASRSTAKRAVAQDPQGDVEDAVRWIISNLDQGNQSVTEQVPSHAVGRASEISGYNNLDDDAKETANIAFSAVRNPWKGSRFSSELLGSSVAAPDCFHRQPSLRVDLAASPFTCGLHRRVERRRSSNREPQKRTSTLIARMNATCVFTKSMRDVNVHWGFEVDIDILKNVCQIYETYQLVGFVDGPVARFLCKFIPSVSWRKRCWARVYLQKILQENESLQGEDRNDEKERKEVWHCDVRLSGGSNVRERAIKALRRSGLPFTIVNATQEIFDNPIVINRTAGTVQNSQESLEGIIDDLQNVTSSLDLSLVRMETLRTLGLRTTLYDYQLRGINWMLSRECRQDGEGGENATLSTCTNASLNKEDCYLIDSDGNRNNLHSQLKPDNVSNRSSTNEFVYSALWKKVTGYGGISHYESVIAKVRRTSRPEPIFGGILADDMGLGKTIQVLSLILSNDPDRALRADKAESGCKRAKTLIVCPVSVLTSWDSQIERHIEDGKMTKMILHSKYLQRNCNVSSRSLSDYDVVLTSYETLRNLYQRWLFNRNATHAKKDGRRSSKQDIIGNQNIDIFDMRWWRVILDEAHWIKNRKTRSHRACLQLTAINRWCLTATPLQNDVDDIQSLLQFLRVEPLDKYSTWLTYVKKLLKTQGSLGITRLRVVMQAFCLRRSKALLASSLPPLSIQTHTVRLHGHHLHMYNLLFESASSVFFALDEHGGTAVMRRYSSVLECILRLRQTCCSSRGVSQQRMERARYVLSYMERKKAQQAGDEENATKLLTREEADKMLEKLSGKEETMECVVCLDDLDEETKRVIRSCCHCFCEDCVMKLLELSSGGDAVCPLCRGKFSKGDVFSVEQTREAQQNLARNASDEDEDGERQTDRVQAEEEEREEEEQRLSPKIQALLVDEQEAQQADKTVKSVVFSSFLSCLDEIESAMIAAGIPIFRIDGKTSILQRRRLIQDFDTYPQGALLLLSTKVGGVGLSLTMASRAYMMEPWWNAAVDEQAMHRLHRIGQTRPVTIIRYMCQGTIEQKIMEMQEKKDWLGKAAMMRMAADELLEMRLRLFRTLFLR